MNFNLSSTSLLRMVEEGSLLDVSRLQELAEPPGLQTSFNYTGKTLVQLRKALSDVYMGVGSDWGSSNIKWQDFDGEATVLIHRTLSELPRELAMSKGF